MKEPRWVIIEVALAVHRMLLAEHGGGEGLRDEKLLESALSRARQKYTYEPDSSLFGLAAGLSFGLVKNHAFVDGNKRVALTLGLVFLDINGIEIAAPEADAAVTFEELAAGRMSKKELSEWFQKHAIAFRKPPDT